MCWPLCCLALNMVVTVAEIDSSTNPADKGRRLFLACWPDQSLQATLYSLARRLQRKHGGRRTPRQNIHLTLLFLGQVHKQKEQEFRDRLRSLDANEFELELDRVGSFGRCKIKWVGPSIQPNALRTMYSDLRLISNEFGFHTDEKAFRPHITLLRNSHGAAVQEIKPLSWKVDSYYLIESVQTREGVEYRIVEEFKLSDE